MTERVIKLAVGAFRGVPDKFAIDFEDGRSLLVLGDNGTGKSTIADALEFYFTGRVDYLAHEGRESATRNLAATQETDTYVEVATGGSLGGRVSHGEGLVHAVIEADLRETFLLRGRTLADFVNKTKGEKWRYLFEILGMQDVDQLRLDLQTARNALEGDHTRARSAFDTGTQALRKHLPAVTSEALLAVIQQRCESAGIQPPETLEAALDPRWAASFAGRSAALKGAIQLASVLDIVKALESSQKITLAKGWNSAVQSTKAADAARMRLIEAANDLVENLQRVDTCPLCGQRIDESSFKERLERSLEELRSSSERLRNAEGVGRRLIEHIAAEWSKRNDLRERAKGLGVSLPELPDSYASVVGAALKNHRLIDEKGINDYERQISAWDLEASGIIGAAIPAHDVRDEVLIELGVLIEQAKTWRRTGEDYEKARRALAFAERLLRVYMGTQNRYFMEVLDQISDRVAEIYERLHPGEGLSNVRVEPWTEKGVELAVDFHGSALKPPHGVLSESHLNSLAIALFLAMAETFNELLGFLVLDDVVNSFDVEHRGHLAELLATRYSDRQLIVLTHDQLFYQHLARRAPSWMKMEFTSWTYERGPRTSRYETGGLVEKAIAMLEQGDTNAAATKGRRATEELLQEICEGLQAPLPFRRGYRNDQRIVGELVPGLRRVLKKLKVEDVALDDLLRNLEADVEAALNPEAHAGRGWASPEEVRACLERLASMEAWWTCPSCASRVWTVGTPEACRCKCGKKGFPPATGNRDP